MKENLKKLALIFRFTMLKPEMFYSISVSSFTISLQASYSSDFARTCQKLFKKSEISSDSGFIEFKRNNIRITLT